MSVPASSSHRRLIVTRPAHEAAQWVEKLRAVGIDARPLPLIDIAPTTDASAIEKLHTAWQNLQQYAACMFVSANAVRYFFQIKQADSQVIRAQAAPNLVAYTAANAVPGGLRFLAPGPGTAAALQAEGVDVLQIDSPPADAAQFDSAALWDVIGSRNWQAARVLVVRGNSAAPAGVCATAASAPLPRDWLTQQFQAAGGQVDVLTVYERRAPTLSRAQSELACTASADGSVWLFSSSEAVAHLRQVPALTDTDWSAAVAIATHPRIAQAAQAAGFGTVLSSRPALLEIVQTLRSIESTAP